ncbi:MAG: hypothetical protein VW496_01260 [Pelagibacteraceae bacterium]
MTEKKERRVRWEYNEDVTPIEFIRRIKSLVCEPVETLQEWNGDMWMSDYRKLSKAAFHIEHALRQLDKEEIEND